ncbi:MAG: SDR family oxidoreductase [Bacteroidetes bacterium]|nr:SDR family oxidoreductase [Bacteroidota bacterium]
MELSLRHRTAVICGSTQGIGYGIAQELAGLGADCILLARNEAQLMVRSQALPKTEGQQHGYRVADFTDTSAVRQAIDSIVADTTVHILVNNTGGPAPGLITQASPTAFTQAFEQHLVNNQTLVQAVLPGMRQAGYGRILNVISTSVRIPLRNLGVSNTIRGAVASWAKSLSNEVAADGITVNNLLPGFIETSRLESLIGTMAKARETDPETIAQELRLEIPAGRFGKVHEIAALAAFLASPAAAYINGTSITVDGGRTGSI